MYISDNFIEKYLKLCPRTKRFLVAYRDNNSILEIDGFSKQEHSCEYSHRFFVYTRKTTSTTNDNNKDDYLITLDYLKVFMRCYVKD